jgi:hypothetical protein
MSRVRVDRSDSIHSHEGSRQVQTNLNVRRAVNDFAIGASSDCVQRRLAVAVRTTATTKAASRLPASSEHTSDLAAGC